MVGDLYRQVLDDMSERELTLIKHYSYDYPPVSKRFRNAEVLPIRDSNANPKIHRNSLCSCGSNKKYKNCCLKK